MSVVPGESTTYAQYRSLKPARHTSTCQLEFQSNLSTTCMYVNVLLTMLFSGSLQYNPCTIIGIMLQDTRT